MKKSPAVELNRAIAVGMAFGFERGLAALDCLASEPVLREHYLLHAARADFLRRLNRNFEATIAYRRALSGAPTLPERTFFERRLRELASNPKREQQRLTKEQSVRLAAM